MISNKIRAINIISVILAFAVQMIISFWLSPFVIDSLGEEAFGFINLSNNFVSYASLLAVAINSMSCRYISVEYNCGNVNEAKSYFTSVFIFNLFLSAVIFIFSLFLVCNLDCVVEVSAVFFNQVKLTFLFSFFTLEISLIGTVYTVASFVSGKMHYNSLVQIVSNIVKCVLIYSLFVFFSAKIYFLSIATLIASIITVFGNYFITKKLIADFGICFGFYDFRKLIILFKSGFGLLITSLSNIMLNGFDLLFCNWFVNGSAMGRLSIAKQIPLALSIALCCFLNIFSSELTKIYAKDGKSKIVVETIKQLKILSFIFTVPFAGIIVFGKDFLLLWLRGSSYTQEQYNELYLIMILVLVDIIVSAYMYSLHSVFVAIDKVKTYSMYLLVSSVVSIFLTLVLLRFTNLGVFAIAGTSSLILGGTHGIIVPAVAAKLLNCPIVTFWKIELMSWFSLFVIVCLFLISNLFMSFHNWNNFFCNVLIAGVIGYFFEFIIIFSKKEKMWILNIMKSSH